MAGSLLTHSRAEVELTRRQRMRAVVASTIGSTIEWYDFNLYGLTAAIYFGELFFPTRDPVVGTLAALGTLGVGYVARPVGAVLFGHFGDRIGRKATLILTLVVMGLSTFFIGLLPTYASIGIAAPALLVLLRICQGLAVSGEWGGALVLTAEWSSARRRGFFASWPVLGVPAGAALAVLALQISTALLGQNSYWGWRLPFVISVVLVLIGLYIRLGVLETPVFSKLLEERRVEAMPVVRLLQHDLRQVVVLVLALAGVITLGIIQSSFALTYTIQYLHLPQRLIFTFQLVTAILGLFAYLIFGWLSDRIGRKRMFGIGVVTLALFAFPYWLMLDSRQILLVFFAFALEFPIGGMMQGPFGAIAAESFTGRWRYSGATLSYQLGAVIFGGTAPVIALALLTAFNSTVPIAIYVVITSIISFIALLLIRDRSRQDLSIEYDQQDTPPAPRATSPV